MRAKASLCFSPPDKEEALSSNFLSRLTVVNAPAGHRHLEMAFQKIEVPLINYL